MDNQHRVIKGYRELDAQEIADINAAKALGEQCEQLLLLLNNQPQYDRRWLAIAKTHLQEGIMAAVRTVARPEGF